MKIGVFDSGVGGMSVAQTLQQAYPEHDVLYTDDHEHVPYGSRQPAEILGFVEPILEALVELRCQVIVIACNTVSTTLINELRQRFDVPLIAMEPMIKPAAGLTESKVIAVCATPATLASERYHWLKDTYAKGIKVIEPDCSRWSYMIEHDEIEDALIADVINDVCQKGADVIVLGCTHYHWIEDKIKQVAGSRAQVLQPESSIVRRLAAVIADLPQTD
jgi:glutamate racemase